MKLSHAAEVANWIGSTIEGSSCSDLLTRIENGHIRMGSAGKGRINLRGVGSSLSQQAESPGASISVIRSWISATEFIGVCRDNREVRIHCPKFGFF
jgi:hypothetical protein